MSSFLRTLTRASAPVARNMARQNMNTAAQIHGQRFLHHRQTRNRRSVASRYKYNHTRVSGKDIERMFKEMDRIMVNHDPITDKDFEGMFKDMVRIMVNYDPVTDKDFEGMFKDMDRIMVNHDPVTDKDFERALEDIDRTVIEPEVKRAEERAEKIKRDGRKKMASEKGGGSERTREEVVMDWVEKSLIPTLFAMIMAPMPK